MDVAPPHEPGALVAIRDPGPPERFQDPVRERWCCDGGAVSDHGAGIDVAGAERAVEAMRELLHARFDGNAAEMADLYRLVGDLTRLAHSTAEAVTILTQSLQQMADAGRLHHDDTRRPVPTATLSETLARLQRGRLTLDAAGDVLGEAHNHISHFYVTDRALRVVPEPDDETPVGEHQ